MSNAEIERLLQDRSLIRESFDDEQVAGFWTKAMASFGGCTSRWVVNGRRLPDGVHGCAAGLRWQCSPRII